MASATPHAPAHVEAAAAASLSALVCSIDTVGLGLWRTNRRAVNVHGARAVAAA